MSFLGHPKGIDIPEGSASVFESASAGFNTFSPPSKTARKLYRRLSLERAFILPIQQAGTGLNRWQDRVWRIATERMHRRHRFGRRQRASLRIAVQLAPVPPPSHGPRGGGHVSRAVSCCRWQTLAPIRHQVPIWGLKKRLSSLQSACSPEGTAATVSTTSSTLAGWRFAQAPSSEVWLG